jgi:DNA-binding NtrC family response regulator
MGWVLPETKVEVETDYGFLRKPRVLVVEDEPRLRELLLDVIPDMGFTATAARTAEEASRLMEAEAREILILDLQLPLMHGMDLFRQVRQRWRNTQVIVLTGFGDLDSARDAIRLDVVDFLSKPCHLREVEIALDRARQRVAAIVMGPPAAAFAPKPAAPAVAPLPAPDERETLDDVERQQILKVLARHNGNKTRAAAELGICRRTLHYRLASYRQGSQRK